jgi:hypothetical protein
VSRRSLVASLVGLLGILANAHVADAQEAPPSPTLLLHVAAESAAVTAIDERLRARLEALGVALRLQPEPTVDVAAALDGNDTRTACNEGPLAEAWLDGLVPGEATLVLVPCGLDSALARRLAAPDGFDDVLLAELELILDRAAQALLSAQPVGGTRQAARAALDDEPPPVYQPEPAPAIVKPAPRAPAPTSAATSLASQLGFAVGVQGWSGDNPALPAGGVFGGVERVSGPARLGLALSVGARGAARVSTTQAELSIWGGDVHLWLTAGRAFPGAGIWRLSAGPGVDLSHVTSSRADGAPTTGKPASRTDLDATIGAQLRWDVVALGTAHVFAAATVDVLPRVARYTAIIDDQSVTIAQPWRVRPSLVLGVAFDPSAP